MGRFGWRLQSFRFFDFGMSEVIFWIFEACFWLLVGGRGGFWIGIWGPSQGLWGLRTDNLQTTPKQASHLDGPLGPPVTDTIERKSGHVDAPEANDPGIN